MKELLQVADLHVEFKVPGGVVHAVKGAAYPTPPG
jgi:hypothetical protein